MSKRSRKGISSVIGAAIALAIFFTVIIPTLLYIQNLQTLFMQEATKRLQYELERIHESMKVHLSLASRPGEGYVIFLIMENSGTLSINVPTVYLESSARGLLTYPAEEILGKAFFAPGEIYERDTGQYFQRSDEVIRAKIVTLRGNNFISESIGPKQLPYLLLVSLENMNASAEYTVRVYRWGTDHGCILSGIVADQLCGDLAEYKLVARMPGESGVAVFMVAPGNYRVELLKDGLPAGIDPQLVTVFHDTVLRFRLPQPSLPAKAPLSISTHLSDNTVVVIQSTSGMVIIPYEVFLKSNSEPMQKIKIGITISCSGLTCNPTSAETTIDKLLPGESFSNSFTININDENVENRYGGRLSYTISIREATGTLTGRVYTGSDIENPSITKSIIVCRPDSNNKLTCRIS